MREESFATYPSYLTIQIQRTHFRNQYKNLIAIEQYCCSWFLKGKNLVTKEDTALFSVMSSKLIVVCDETVVTQEMPQFAFFYVVKYM